LQFEQQSLILPAHHNDVRKLDKLSKYIKKHPLISVNKLLKQDQQRKGLGIILKEVSTSKIQTNSIRLKETILPYLAKNNFTNLTSIQFPLIRVSGPSAVMLENTKYQLYLASRSKHPHFTTFMRHLPLSVRITIPVIISLLLCWLLARSLVKPILAMQYTAAKFGNGDLLARVPSSAIRKDEIGELAANFNTMAEKLASNFDAHQRLLADVSHELRSPMTRLQIALALANKFNEQPQELSRHLARCELEVTRLDEMISDVLSLSRLENSHQLLTYENVNLTELIIGVVEDEQYTANEKSITITTDLTNECYTLIDSQLMCSAVSNVVSNAIKYSPEQSTVSVSLVKKSSEITITISDSGSGVPNADLVHLFKPFYRVSQARDRATGGTGLGLAITQQAIVAHKGTVTAQNNDGVGLTITIVLPLTTG